MVIAIATPDYPPDPRGTGIGTYSRILAERLASRGHIVHVATRGSSSEDIVERSGCLSVHRIGALRPEIPMELNALKVAATAARSFGAELRYRRRLAALLNRLVEREGVELIESAESFAESYFYEPSPHPGVPFVIRMHTPLSVGELFDRNLPEIARRLVRRYERKLIMGADFVSATSAHSADFFRGAMGLGRKPIRVYPNPPPLGEAPAVAPESASDEPLVLYVGRMTKIKGVRELARAIPEVLAERPEARFAFVGADAPNPDGGGSMIESIRSSIPEGLRPRVEFAGHVPHGKLEAYYARAACCVFPSHYDCFGYTCLEAMLHGRAVIGSEHGGMADLLAGGRAGLLCSPSRPEGIAWAILRLLREPALRAELGARARERALGPFGPEAVMPVIEEFYQDCIRDLRAAPGA